VPSVPRTDQPSEPHPGVEPAEASVPRTTATVAMRRSLCGAAENRTRTSSVRTTKVTFHTTPHQRPESNRAPSFWRRRCALRSLASATPKGIEPSSRRRQRRSLSRCLRGLAASSPRVERGPCALGVRRPLPAGRGADGTSTAAPRRGQNLRVECRSRTELPRFHRAPSLPNE